MVALAQVPQGIGRVIMHRIGEPIQSDTALLTRLRRAGFRPNAALAVSQANGRVRIGTGRQAAGSAAPYLTGSAPRCGA